MDDAIRDAVRALVPDVGYAALTMDAVAAKARVGKGAVYASRGELVFARLVHGRETRPQPDTDTLSGDLTGLANVILAVFRDPVVAAATPGRRAGRIRTWRTRPA